jgi:trypsin-like peptidase
MTGSPRLPLKHLLLGLTGLIMAGPFTSTNAQQSMIDQAMDRLWQKYKNAILYIELPDPNGTAGGKKIGTGFMITDRFALTAGHVLCNLDTGQSYYAYEIHIGGPSGPKVIPNGAIICGDTALDYAVIPLPGVGSHFNFASHATLARNRFVTFYGFGRSHNGEHRESTASENRDEWNRYLTDLNAAEGDSGSPVLNRSGGAVGILTSGNGQYNTTGFLPLTAISRLSEIGIDRASLTNDQIEACVTEAQANVTADRRPFSVSKEIRCDKPGEQQDQDAGIQTEDNRSIASIVVHRDETDGDGFVGAAAYILKGQRVAEVRVHLKCTRHAGSPPSRAKATLSGVTRGYVSDADLETIRSECRH